MLGVDGCRDGWVGVAPDAGLPRAYAAPTLREVVTLAELDGAVAHVGVDIPIGLADQGWRAADVEVQARLGRRRSSLFRTPVRAALTAPDHASGVEISRRASRAGFSIQAWGLRRKILEVDAFVTDGETRVFEAHPELSFAAMAGRPAAYPKKTWAGQRERLALLTAAGIDLDRLVGEVGLAAPDDVIDAAAVAWTARRRSAGEAGCVPLVPEPMPHGRTAAIWA